MTESLSFGEKHAGGNVVNSDVWGINEGAEARNED